MNVPAYYTLLSEKQPQHTLQALFITCGDQSLPSHIVLGSRLCYRKQEMIVQNLRAASESHIKAKSQHSMSWCILNKPGKKADCTDQYPGDFSSLAWLSQG